MKTKKKLNKQITKSKLTRTKTKNGGERAKKTQKKTF